MSISVPASISNTLLDHVKRIRILERLVPAAGFGAWAFAAGGDYAGLSNIFVPNDSSTALGFSHFETDDTSVFSTSPSNASGDTAIIGAAKGIYIIELVANWSLYFDGPSTIFPTVTSGPSTDSYTSTGFDPATAVAGIDTPGAGGVGPPNVHNHATLLRVIGSSGMLGPATELSVGVQAFQRSGTSRSVNGFVLAVAWIPGTGKTATVVY